MNSHNIQKINDNEFHVYENTTDQVIYKSKDRNVAKKFVRKINGGFGFKEWTPAFFLKPYVKGLENDNSNSKKTSQTNTK